MLRQRNEGNVLGVVLLNIFDGFVDKRILYLRYARLRVGLEAVDCRIQSQWRSASSLPERRSAAAFRFGSDR
mgnify:CR=1 FL=1